MTLAKEKVGEYPFMVEPFHCDFSNHLLMSYLSNSLLNAADYHSADRGYGISYLNAHHLTWVLSRLAIEMEEMPVAYDKLTIATWVESAFRYFTSRNFSVTSADGSRVYGYGRSIWAMIDTDTRQPVDIGTVNEGLIQQYIETEHPCPIAKPSRVPAGKEEALARTLEMHYSDIDVNGHVNSVKYIEHILDLFDMDWHRTHRLKRLDIAYVSESHAGDRLRSFIDDCGDGKFLVRMTKEGREDVDIVRCGINFIKI